jgi:hypothetical protein
MLDFGESFFASVIYITFSINFNQFPNLNQYRKRVCFFIHILYTLTNKVMA